MAKSSNITTNSYIMILMHITMQIRINSSQLIKTNYSLASHFVQCQNEKEIEMWKGCEIISDFYFELLKTL